MLALLVSLGAAAEDPYAPYDWVPIDDLTEEQLELLRPGCCGVYISPVRDDEDALLHPDDSPIRAFSDTAERSREGLTTLEGNVLFTQGYRSIEAECARYDPVAGSAEASGNVVLREPGVLLRADSAQVDLDTGDAQLDGARFVLHGAHFRGSAEQLDKVGMDMLRLTNSEITRCEPGRNDWVLEGSDIRIYPDQHYGTARHARFKLFNVPVFYTPYVRFPVGDERQTGFLFPAIGESRRDGVEFSLPFYWNIAPNYDMTITPNYMSRRGTLWNVEGRHLARHFETTVDGSWISTDRGGYSRRLENQIARGEITEEEAYPFRGEERWRVQLDQTGGAGERWSTEIDYTDLSDNDYLRDLDSGSLDVNRSAVVRQMAGAGYQSEHWTYGIRVEELRSLTTARWPHREVPRVNADGRYYWNNWQLDLDNEYARFDLSRTFEGTERQIENIVIGERVRTDYGLTWNQEWLWGFVRPRAMVKTLSYELDDGNLLEGAETRPSLVVPQGSLDTGLFFERYGSALGTPYLQTFEPRLFYFYSDYEDHGELLDVTAGGRAVNFDTKDLTFSYDQLYRTTRFAGGDRIDDANQLSVGLTTRFIDALSGTEHLSLSVGQIFYFEDRRVGLREPRPAPEGEIADHERTRSDVAAQVNARVTDRWSLTTNVTYDPFEHEYTRANASLRYLDSQYRIFNVSYRFNRRPPAPGRLDPTEELDRSQNQIDATFHWPVYGRWSLIGRGHYDITYRQELDTFLGLEYDDCCYRIRLLARRWLNFDYTFSSNFLETVGPEDLEDSIILDIQFKGLGSVNRRVGDLLQKAIPGYGARETHYISD
ncbi:LPS-assembly protein LptD [Marinimicrobium sp. ABcell2]|uniref:LPS-assembly protein LptD n=1 Tax=Marinimicrobium sp. ABcell2 TaxID=3069751 RepID=UPI0027B044F9|nr:LPS-assembly protein LptD [Marinimicrobium sp. ABcell2]MDQ2077590.1 LPS-assembly protein LptD [Marinimicrobium sp. ABcell2]